MMRTLQHAIVVGLLLGFIVALIGSTVFTIWDIAVSEPPCATTSDRVSR
jgi:hypothetical protein